jgi:hypothetical protein
MNPGDLDILDRIKFRYNETYLENTVIYVCPELVPSGEFDFGDIKLILPWNAYLVFIDLNPKANWGHNCCYIAFEKGGNKTIRVEAQFPPFFISIQWRFILFWKGPDIPDWAVMTYPD